MIGSISGFNAASYLDQVKGVAKPAPVASQPQQNKPKSETTQSPEAPLQSGNGLNIPSSLLSLLQDADSGSSSGQQLSALLQGPETNSALSSLSLIDGSGTSAGIYSALGGGSGGGLASLLGSSDSSELFDIALVAASSTTPLNQAVQQATQQAANAQTQQNNLSANLGAYQAGFAAYNSALQQSAQAAINTSKQVQASISA